MDKLIDFIVNLIFKRVPIVLIVMGTCFVLTGLSGGVQFSDISWYINDDDSRNNSIFFGVICVLIGLYWLHVENGTLKRKSIDTQPKINDDMKIFGNKTADPFNSRPRASCKTINGELLIALTRGLNSSSSYSVIQESANSISPKLSYMQVYQLTSRLDTLYRPKCLKLLIPNMKSPVTGSQAVRLLSGINVSSVRAEILILLAPLFQYPLSEGDVKMLLAGLHSSYKQKVSLTLVRYSKIR